MNNGEDIQCLLNGLMNSLGFEGHHGDEIEEDYDRLLNYTRKSGNRFKRTFMKRTICE